MYNTIAGKYLLFIYQQSKDSAYEYYEVSFQKRNFMHLAGIKSATLGAEQFLEACLDDTITLENCTPKHSVNNMHSKISVLDQLLDFRRSKCYKIGEKDLVTKNNDFEMATGNGSGIIGYDSRVSEQRSRNINKECRPIPTTLLTNPITDYCSTPQRIVFVLEKDSAGQLYNCLHYEIKEDLFETVLDTSSDDLIQLIEISAFIKVKE